MNPLWILAAFLFGTVISRVGLPPLVGYLLAGFALNSFGVTGGELLESIADAGVTLLLFTIGLKLKIKSLAKPEVWSGTSIHMIVTVIVLAFVIRMAGFSGIPLFDQLTWQTSLLIAFALSFSSTVFAVKVIEGKKEMAFYLGFPHRERLLFRGHNHDPRVVCMEDGRLSDRLPAPGQRMELRPGLAWIVTCGALVNGLCMVWDQDRHAVTSLSL